MPKKIMLLDGFSMLNRAFYALPPLNTSDGTPVNAVLGFLNMFFKLLDDDKPDFAAVAFDMPSPTFRHGLLPEYKGTRKAMPDELRAQVPVLAGLLEKMRIKRYEARGFEADDLLGTLAAAAADLGLDVVLVSGDRDLLQVASDKVCVKIPSTRGGKTVTEDFYAADVLEKKGVTPLEYIDVKALMGDASDNIPGVPGIGEKTAVKIIQAYKTVENAILNAHSITPKRASANLTEYKEQALMSKKLATILTDAPVAVDLDEMSTDGIFGGEAFSEIKRLEFKSLYKRYESHTQDKDIPVQTASKSVILESDGEIAGFLPELLLKEKAAFRLIMRKGVFEGISFAFDADSSVFVRALFAEFDENRILGILKPFFESGVKKITYDAKGAAHILAKQGINLENIVFDVMLGAYVLNTDSDYADASALFGAYPAMRVSLAACGMESLYDNMEMPLTGVLFGMETAGIKIDKRALEEYGGALAGRIAELTESVCGMAGEVFNINSTKQLGRILFEKLSLPVLKKTKTGYSTDADTLERLAGEHPIVDALLEYRQLAKLKSTYVDGLLAVTDALTGKIYSTFNQAVTSTGRLSSTEPNLQNIPVRTALGRELRKVFVPSGSEYVFIDADYSQIELRVLAHMSGDETFIEAFNAGRDVHSLTASEVFGVPLESVSKEQRAAAKTVNFGIIYGQSAFSLARELGITIAGAERYIDGYFNRYPSVKSFMKETISRARETGYTETIMGRRRVIPELSSSNHNVRAFGERAAMNMPIQGSAADIIKIAMIKTDSRLRGEGLKSRLLLQVHDELLVEAHIDEVEKVMEILKNEMENAVSLKVPLTVDIQAGANWYEAKS